LREIYELLKFGPTSANSSPARILFLRTAAAKERLRPALSEANVPKVMNAPVAAIIGNRGQVNYAAAKGALNAATRSLALELASRGITVNAVAPGFIQTAMTDVLSDQQKELVGQRIPAGRMGMPQEIAAAVAYLASEEAAYVTGETIHINGGMAMI